VLAPSSGCGGGGGGGGGTTSLPCFKVVEPACLSSSVQVLQNI